VKQEIGLLENARGRRRKCLLADKEFDVFFVVTGVFF
jgi:hypothetical protein